MLIQAIGALLPTAMGVALSPIPIIAVVLMLSTPRARSNGPAFAAGWVLGLTAVSIIIVIVAGGSDDPSSATASGVNWAQVGIGLLFLAMARRQWSGRPKRGELATLPAWLDTIDDFTAQKSFVLGLALSAANPKNLALTAAAGATIANAGLSSGEDLAAVAVFVVLGSITVAGAVGYYLLDAERAAGPLRRVKIHGRPQRSDHDGHPGAAGCQDPGRWPCRGRPLTAVQRPSCSASATSSRGGPTIGA